jgi:hypothetical protein
MMKKARIFLRKLTKKQAIIGVFVLLVVLSSGLFYLQKRAETTRAEVVTRLKADFKDKIKALDNIQKEIKDSYLDEKSGFLKQTTAKADINKIEKKLSGLKLQNKVEDKQLEKDKATYNQKILDVSKSFENLSITFEAQTQTNALFEAKTPVLVDKNVKKDATIVDDLKVETVNEIYVKDLNDNEFSKAVEALKAEALNQLKYIDTQKKAVATLFKDGQPQDNEEGYNKIKVEVDKIKNGKFKKDLHAKLEQVKKVIDENNQKEVDEKARQEAEQAAASSGGTAVQGSDGSWSVQTSSGQVVAPNQASSGTSGTTNSGSVATPTTPNAPSQPSTPSTPVQPTTPSAPTIVAGAIGNSGMLFNSIAEAQAWVDTQVWDEKNKWFMMSDQVVDVVYSDGSRKWTVNFF